MPTIILSYRREDTAWIAGRIHDRLREHYGNEHVFMDIDSIPFGLDFREHIQDSLERCDILLAIIGPRWVGPDESGQARIHDEADWVRIEIEAALAKKIPVIPVLIDGARMPSASGLPDGVRDIVFRQAADVDAGRDFHPHMDRLIGVMDKLLARKGPAPEPEPEPEPEPAKRAEAKAPRKGEPAKAKEAPRKEPPVKAETKTPKAARVAATTDGATGTSSRWEKLWQLFASREGRLPRRQFAPAVIGGFLVTAVLVIGVGIPVSEAMGTPQDFPVVVLVFPLAWAWTLFVLAGKRLHDLGWDAWPIAVLLLAPVLIYFSNFGVSLGDFVLFSSLAILALLLLSPLGWLRGTEGPNRFGPDPLEASQTDAGLR